MSIQFRKNLAVVTAEDLPQLVDWLAQRWSRATVAKFEQNAKARETLLSTGGRPLTHQMKNDSRALPGAILAAIWIRCRRLCAIHIADDRPPVPVLGNHMRLGQFSRVD